MASANANDNDDDTVRLGKMIGGPRACIIRETNCFVSTEAAIAHCHGDWAVAKAKIAAGEIVIGEPEGEPGQSLLLFRSGRYGILLTPLARDRD